MWGVVSLSVYTLRWLIKAIQLLRADWWVMQQSTKLVHAHVLNICRDVYVWKHFPPTEFQFPLRRNYFFLCLNNWLFNLSEALFISLFSIATSAFIKVSFGRYNGGHCRCWEPYGAFTTIMSIVHILGIESNSKWVLDSKKDLQYLESSISLVFLSANDDEVLLSWLNCYLDSVS